MKTLNPDPWTTILAGSRAAGTAITVRDYSALHAAKDRRGIADLIRLRFTERYLDPALDNPQRHGFSILATCCLMVEALESFRNGWKGTQGVKGGSQGVFVGFLNTHQGFHDLKPVAADFYTHVRCGIIHQAETTGRWTVNRGGTLYSSSDGAHRLSASEFGKRLRTVLYQYTDTLAKADWGDGHWRNARHKFRAICRNCGISRESVKKLQ